MNVAIYAPFLSDKELHNRQSFDVSTFFLLLSHPAGRIFLLTESPANIHFSPPPGVELIAIMPFSKNALLRKIWWDMKLPALLKRIKAELFISFDHRCSSAVSVPQCIIVRDPAMLKANSTKIARLFIVISNSAKLELIQKHKIPGEKIAVVYPSPDPHYRPLDMKKKEDIRRKYSEGCEFFLCPVVSIKEKSFVDLLRSFSHFKKRQQSNFQLLLISEQKHFPEKALAGYKYRNDVKLIHSADKKEVSMIMASAYAVILPFHDKYDLITGLNAMQAGAPVITTEDSPIIEIAGEIALYSEQELIRSLGEKMMQVYTNETYRSALIERGKATAATSTHEKRAKHLWQVIDTLIK